MSNEETPKLRSFTTEAEEQEEFIEAVEQAADLDKPELPLPTAQPQTQVTIDQILASLGGKTIELDIARGQFQQALQYIKKLEDENRSLRAEIKRLSKGKPRH